MVVNVGTALYLKGRNYICIEIQQIDTTHIAKEDYATMKTWLFSGANVQYIQHDHCDFTAGDIIHHTGERLQLECPGVDLLFIWTRSKIEKVEKEKEINDEQFRVEDKLGESADNQIEGSGVGDSGRKGDGKKDSGEVGGELYGHGSSREGGDSLHPKDSEGCQSTFAFDGSDR